MSPRRPPPPALTPLCLCGALARERSASGRWFCDEHRPRRETPPPPPPARPKPARPKPAPPKPAPPKPAQADLFEP